MPSGPPTQKYTVALPNLQTDQVYYFKAGKQQIVIIRYSKQLQNKFKVDMSKHPGYFVAYAFGTYLSCPLEVVENQFLKESCSSARYDFAGQPVSGNQNFTALQVPVYNFCEDYSCINLRL